MGINEDISNEQSKAVRRIGKYVMNSWRRVGLNVQPSDPGSGLRETFV